MEGPLPPMTFQLFPRAGIAAAEGGILVVERSAAK